MYKIILLFSLMFLLFSCEYKTIDIKYEYHVEDGIIVKVKHWQDTVITYDILLKMPMPQTDNNYLTIIRSLSTNEEYEFRDYSTYRQFEDYENCNVKIKFKHTLREQINKESETRVLENIEIDQIYLVE